MTIARSFQSIVEDGRIRVTVNITPYNIANQPPINTVPSAQTRAEDTALLFSAAGGNAISVGDPDAGIAALQVTLSVTSPEPSAVNVTLPAASLETIEPCVADHE